MLLCGDKVLEVSTTVASTNFRKGENWVFRKFAIGDVVLVTRGEHSPFHRRGLETVEGMVVDKSSSFLHIAVPRYPQVGVRGEG